MDNSLVVVGLTVTNVAIGFYLAFFKSYFQEKGKNLATKKDIGEITQIVEETKKQFTTEIELLRGNLNLFGQNFNSIKTLEREALIDVGNKYSAWLNSLLNFNLVFYSYDYYEPLVKLPFVLGEKHTEFNIAEDNLHLYFHDTEIMSVITELKTSTHELEGEVFQSISSFIANCIIFNNEKENVSTERHIDLHQKYHERQQPVISRNLTQRNILAQNIMSNHVRFVKILNFRIHQIFN